MQSHPKVTIFCVWHLIVIFCDGSICSLLFGTIYIKPCNFRTCITCLTQGEEHVSLSLTLGHVCEDISLSLCVSCHHFLMTESSRLRTLPLVPIFPFLVFRVSKSVSDVSLTVHLLHVSLSCVSTSSLPGFRALISCFPASNSHVSVSLDLPHLLYTQARLLSRPCISPLLTSV